MARLAWDKLTLFPRVHAILLHAMSHRLDKNVPLFALGMGNRALTTTTMRVSLSDVNSPYEHIIKQSADIDIRVRPCVHQPIVFSMGEGLSSTSILRAQIRLVSLFCSLKKHLKASVEPRVTP